MGSIDRSRVAVIGSACLWLFLTGLYATSISVLALPGLVPALALLHRGQGVRVLVSSLAAGLLATAFGAWVVSTAIPSDPVGLAGFVIVPLAATTYSYIAWRSLEHL